MRDIKIKVNDEGYVSAYEKFIGNQYEHEATRLLFELPDSYKGDNLFQYVVFTLCDGTVKIRQMIEDACIIDRDITNVTGLLLMEVVIKNIENAEDLTTGLVINSQVISGFIKPASYNPDKIIGASIDSNIRLYLDEFDALLAEIRTADARFAKITESTSSMAEVIDARGEYVNLRRRLDSENKNVIQLVNELINDSLKHISNGTPIPVSDISEMVDISRIYVNATDGNWYYHNGTNWIIGGIYQANGIDELSVSPNKTTFIKSLNIIYYNKPKKNGYGITGDKSSGYVINKSSNRYLSVIDIKSNTDYSLFFTPIYENKLCYFKILSFKESKAEILDYLTNHSSISVSGSLFYEIDNPINFTTGKDDKCLVIQFSDNTPIDYAELREGTMSAPSCTSYEDSLDIFEFQAFNKKETNDLIESFFKKITKNVDVALNETYYEFIKHEGYLVSTSAPEPHAGYNYYEFMVNKDIDLYFKKEDYVTQKYLCISLFRGIMNNSHFIQRYRYNINMGGSDDNLPTLNEKLHIEKGTLLAITVNNYPGNDKFIIYSNYINTYQLRDDISLSKQQIKEVNELVDTSCNKYSLSDNTLTIRTKKAQYIFKRIVNSSINIDTWRLYTGELLSNNNIVARMWNDSDAEGAIRLSNEDDFVCGYHGDEIMTDLIILVDGVMLEANSTVNEKDFNNITIVCKSNVYHCNTSSKANILAFERIKKLSFENEKVRVANDFIVKDTDGLFITRCATMLFQCYKQDLQNDMLIKFVNTSSDINLYPVTMENSNMPSIIDINDDVYYYTKYGVIRQKVIKGYKFDKYQPFIQDYSEQKRIKTYFVYDNFPLLYNDRLISEFEWEIV